MKRAVVLLTIMLTAVFALFTTGGAAKTTVAPIPADAAFTCDTLSISVCDVPVNAADDRGDEIRDKELSTEIDKDEIAEDGINTRVASVWIVCISVFLGAAILIGVIFLAKKNKRQK